MHLINERTMIDTPSSAGPEASCYLFIYLVGDGDLDRQRYCTVLAHGRNLEAAERIALDRVHRQRLKILRLDTATAAPWLDPVDDAEYLADLARDGSALRLRDVEPSRRVVEAA